MAARKVVVRQTGVKKGIFATAVMTSPKGYQYFLFAADKKDQALRLTEKQALVVLDSWRDAERAPAGRCTIDPA